MKLNGDIVFDALAVSFEARRFGRCDKRLNLERPILYDGLTHRFCAGTLTVASADWLPSDPIFEDGACLVCAGSGLPAAYERVSEACVIVAGDADFISACNAVQRIFNRYEAWEGNLRDILSTTADLQSMVDLSYEIFQNPIVIIDAEYRFLAYSSIIDSRQDLAAHRPDKDGYFQKRFISESLREQNYNMGKREPFAVVVDGNTYFSMNLFVGETYVGNLKIAFVLRPFRSGDGALCLHFARILEQAFGRLGSICADGARSDERLYRALLAGETVADTDRRVFFARGPQEGFRCVKLIRGSRSQKKVPIHYFMGQIETTFPGSTAFEYETAIAVVLRYSRAEDELQMSRFEDFLRTLDLTAGLSNLFPLEQIGFLRFCYRQAGIAVEYGLADNPEGRAHFFEDCTLRYLVSHALGEFPLALIDSTGYRELVAYNETVQVDYLQTLHVYLRCERNIAKTAKELYVHRSTLMERLERIKTVLKVDLDDPDRRLELLIVTSAYRMRMLHRPVEDGRDRWDEENPPACDIPEHEFQPLEAQLERLSKG